MSVLASGNSHRSLNLMEQSVTGSYWNLIRWRCSTGGNFSNKIPFSAS